MPIINDYQSGTVSVTTGTTTVTGVDTAWEAAQIRPGDEFMRAGRSVVIASVTDNTHIELDEPWPGATLTDSAYRIRFQPDGSRYTAATRTLVEKLGSGNIEAFAALAGALDLVPIFTGAGAMTLIPKSGLINGVKYDKQVNTLADRDPYDAQVAGFAVLVSDVGDGRSAIYSKNSVTTGDWSDPAYVTGPVGPLASINVGTTTTLLPGTNATVANSGTPTAPVLNFGIPAGRGFYNKGGYDNGTAYAKDDVVSYFGSSYIAKQATTGNIPTDATYWDILAAHGDGGDMYKSAYDPSNKAVDVFDSANHSYSNTTSGLTATKVQGAIDELIIGAPSLKRSIVIVFNGQSNIELDEPFAWVPPPNLKVWNSKGTDETDIGTAFVTPDNTRIGIGLSYAAEVARENPGAAVYLINIGRSATAIAQWKVGAATPKMFDSTKLNIEAALPLIGRTTIDRFGWWLGETDYQLGAATYLSYQDNFEAVMARFYAEAWFPPSTSIAIMAPSPYNDAGNMAQYFNPILRQVTQADPQRRTFVEQDLLPQSYWIEPSLIHMTGAGYREAGRLAYLANERGVGHRLRKTSPILRVKPVTTSISNNNTMAPDPDLGVHIDGQACVVRFKLFGQTSTGAGFKWDLSGPTIPYITWRSRSISMWAPTAPNEKIGSSYPSEEATGASGRFVLEVDVFSNGASAPGNLFLRWAQSVSDAGPTLITAGSTVEKIVTV